MATYPLTWLAEVLREAGCTVVEEGDWKHRGRDGAFAPKAVMLHHDASPKGETSNGADVIINGHDDLPGPLSQLWLDYDGRWHVIAAGRANHGGTGGPWGVVSTDDANADAIGIETDHTTDEKWTDSQLSEGIKGVAALCRRLGITTEAEIGRAVLAHKEYAPSRKVDPDPLDMDRARANLFDYMSDGGGLFGMSTLKAFSYQATQKFHGDGDWKTVHIGEGDALSFLTGPQPLYHLEAGVTLARTTEADSIDTGDVVHLRLQTVVDYEGDKATVISGKYPIHEVTVTAVDSFANLSWLNSLGDTDEKDAKLRLRLFIKPPEGKSLAVSYVAARVAY